MNALRSPAASLAVLLALPLTLSFVRADNWPQWRGPDNDGVSKEKNLPTEWSATKNVAWKFRLPGQGSSTPVVWGDHIFLTCEDGTNALGLAVSTAGKELWRAKLGLARKAGRGDEGNTASPSPSTDGKHVYFFMGNGEVAAFDFDGKEVWRFNAESRYGKFRIAFGMHSTPVLYGDHLYFQLIHDGGGFVVCVEKNTGKDVWKVNRTSDGIAENKHSYASAFLWKNGKDAYLVTHGNDYAIAYNLTDGKEIWRVADLNPKGPSYNPTLRFVASPVCTPDLIVIPSAKNRGVVGLKPDAKGLVKPGNSSEKWRLEKGTPDVPSPVVHDGLVYLGGESGTLTVLDAENGKEFYRRSLGQGRHRGSVVYGDGKIYLTARDGVVSVASAGKEFKKLATNKLPDQIAASPAIANGRIYLHGFEHLWAIEEQKK